MIGPSLSARLPGGSSRSATGTLSAKPGAMLPDALPFRLKLETTAAPLSSAGPARTALNGERFELSVRSDGAFGNPRAKDEGLPTGQETVSTDDQDEVPENTLPVLPLIFDSPDYTVESRVALVPSAIRPAPATMTDALTPLVQPLSDDSAQVEASAAPAIVGWTGGQAMPDRAVPVIASNSSASATEAKPSQPVPNAPGKLGDAAEPPQSTVAENGTELPGIAAKPLHPDSPLATVAKDNTGVPAAGAERMAKQASRAIDVHEITTPSVADRRPVIGEPRAETSAAVTIAGQLMAPRRAIAATGRAADRSHAAIDHAAGPVTDLPKAPEAPRADTGSADTGRNLSPPNSQPAMSQQGDAAATLIQNYQASFAAQTHASAASGLSQPQATPAAFIPFDQQFGQHVAAAIGSAINAMSVKNGMLMLQVTPERLGRIEIEIDPAMDRLQITTESEAVRGAIAQAHGRIEQELRFAGQRITTIDVTARDTATGQSQHGPTDQHGSENAAQHSGSQRQNVRAALHERQGEVSAQPDRPRPSSNILYA